MEKFYNEIVELSIIKENENLSHLLEDIKPIKVVRFTDLEIEADTQQDFSLVLYKKENILTRIIRNIRLSIEKIKIINHSKEVSFVRNTSFENSNKD